MSMDFESYSRFAERRGRLRYPVSLELSYRGLSGNRPIAGQGKTIDISRSGILLSADNVPSVHSSVELMLQWPVLLDNEIPLKLKISGRVVRTDRDRAAIEILQYEFRVSSRTAKRPVGLFDAPVMTVAAQG